jgi:hypothetical protein
MRVVLIVVVLLIPLGISTARAFRSRLDAIVLAFLSVLWMLVNKGFEGPVIWTVDRRHGLTLSDFVGLIGLAIAGIAFLRARSRRSPVRGAKLMTPDGGAEVVEVKN